MQGSAAGDLTDVHAREPFHALELNISALSACSRPRLSRQRRNVFDPVPLGDWDIFLAHPFFVAGFSVDHVNPVLSLAWTENNPRVLRLQPARHPEHPSARADSQTTEF